MGLNLTAELEVMKAVQIAQPHCLFILDANGKFTSEEAMVVLEKLQGISNSQHLLILVYDQRNGPVSCNY